MIDFKGEIIPYKSMGNILIGDNINNYIKDIVNNYKFKISEYVIPSNEKRMSYFLDDTLTIATLSDGKIISVECSSKYEGKCMGLFYPGQKFKELVNNSTRQRIFNGCIVIDDNFGFAFELPSPYDEIGDSIGKIPLELKLNIISVADFSSWKPRKKSK